MLMERSPKELERMRQKLQREQETLRTDLARVEVELEQVDEAITRVGRKRGSKQVQFHGGAAVMSGGRTARDYVRDVLHAGHGPLTPQRIFELAHADGYTGSMSGIHNALPKLIEAGEARKVRDGVYDRASASNPFVPNGNGSSHNHTSQLLPESSPLDGEEGGSEATRQGVGT
jgi:hypothetical protein